MSNDTYLSDELEAIGLGATQRQKIHAHANAQILAEVEQPFTTAEKARVAGCLIEDEDGLLPLHHLPIGGEETVGGVKVDGVTARINPDGTIWIPTATLVSLGLVRPDGVTLTIDANGVMSAVARVAHYYVVDDMAGRLALSEADDLTVVQQVDTQRLWFLNAGRDPSVAANWVDGGSTAGSVTSFKGRTGLVDPMVGDYLAYVPAHQLARAYSAGEVVQRPDGLLYTPNDAIPEGTAFAEGTTGATWRKLLGLATSSNAGLMSKEDKAKLDGIATMTAPDSTTAGTGGLTPDTPIGGGHKFLRGDAEWGEAIGLHDPANAYIAGDRVIWWDVLCEANDDIASGTAFNWGTTGPTWKPVLSSQFVWKGVFSAASTYAQYNVVAATATSRLYICSTPISAGSSDYEPFGGIKRNYWRQWITNYGWDFKGASATLSGQDGLVPAPEAGSTARFLCADGSWSEPSAGAVQYDATKAYASGATAMLGSVPIKANGAIAANTTFAWGTTGATWAAAIPNTTWKGVTSAVSMSAGLPAGSVVADGTAIDSYLWCLRTAITGTTAAFLPGGATPGDWHALNPGRNFTNAWYSGASASKQGLAGIVPASAAGDQERSLAGDGNWLHKGTPWTAGVWKAGDRATYTGVPVECNGTTAATDAFAWGTTGATWKPAFGTGNWRGLYSDSNTYARGDLAYTAAANNLFVCTTDITAAGSANNPDTGSKRDSWQPIVRWNGVPMLGASATLPGRRGLPAVPAAGDQGKMLRGDNTYGYPLLPWTKKAWQAGERCLMGSHVIEANAAITAATDFSWGTTGATWKVVLPDGYSWKGMFANNTSYSAGDVIVHGLGLISPPMLVVSAFTSPASGTLNEAARIAGGSFVGYVQPLLYPSNLTFAEFVLTGATQIRQGGPGFAPAAGNGQQNFPLRGGGSYRATDYLFAAGTGQSNISTATDITAFSQSLARGDLTLNSGGSVTLRANRAYELFFCGCGDGGGGRDTQYQWYNDTAGAYLGVTSIQYGTAMDDNRSNQATAMAAVSFSSDTQVRVRCRSAISVSSLFSAATFMRVMEIA